ncbi:MAG: hypothetical protein AAGF73_11080 [Actinomycetota bacterium]
MSQHLVGIDAEWGAEADALLTRHARWPDEPFRGEDRVAMVDDDVCEFALGRSRAGDRVSTLLPPR